MAKNGDDPAGRSVIDFETLYRRIQFLEDVVLGADNALLHQLSDMRFAELLRDRHWSRAGALD